MILSSWVFVKFVSSQRKIALINEQITLKCCNVLNNMAVILDLILRMFHCLSNIYVTFDCIMQMLFWVKSCRCHSVFLMQLFLIC